MDGPIHWFVLGGPLSPYTVALWEQVARRSSHVVTLAYTPKEDQLSFSHEDPSFSSSVVELVPVASLRTVAGLALRCLRESRPVLVCMGHSPLYNVAVTAIVGACRGSGHSAYYMSDTNGIALIERFGASYSGSLALQLKRMILGTVFATSLDLGFTNALAQRLQGIRNGVALPLLPVDFPSSMEADVPPSLAALVGGLPRPRLLTVARLVRCKNLVALLSAFSSAVREGMPGSLTIVGEGPDRVRLEPLVSHLRGRAVLAGAIPFGASRRMFGAFDAMVLSSTSEAWGIAIIEGLGWGLPVLATRQCGAAVSMALEVGDAVGLCGSSEEDLKTGLFDFLGSLDRRSVAARLVAPRVRQKHGVTAVADALIELGNKRCEPNGLT